MLPNVVATPSSIADIERLRLFSKYFCCIRVAPVTDKRYFGVKEIGGCKQSLFPYFWNPFIRIPANVICTLWKALISWRNGYRYEVIIASNPLGSGLSGLLISKLTKARLIVEVNGNYSRAFKFSHLSESQILFTKLKDKISRLLIIFVLRRASIVKLLYPWQLDSLKGAKNINTCVFHNFVPTEMFQKAKKSDDKFILLLGHPWYLKGVDILIRAFNLITNEFPDYKLKIVGWCPDGIEYYEKLAGKNERIQFSGPVDYKQVVRLMTSCSLYVLASRTEAMGRVLLEAMASRKPIIASDVDGVPYIIKDRYNGLLFRSEDVEDLAEKIRMVLSDNKLAEKLASNGHKCVMENLSERLYIEKYQEVIEGIIESKSK